MDPIINSATDQAIQAAIPLVLGGAVTWFMQKVSAPKGWDNRTVLGIASVALSLGYAVFHGYVPEATQVSIVQFLTSVFGGAVATHQYLVRFIRKE